MARRNRCVFLDCWRVSEELVPKGISPRMGEMPPAATEEASGANLAEVVNDVPACCSGRPNFAAIIDAICPNAVDDEAVSLALIDELSATERVDCVRPR